MESRLFLGMRAVFASEPMEQLMELVRRVAQGNAPVLITGEGGVGKELVARALHQFSSRASRPWVDVHCGALSGLRIEHELFELARTGTLFLDEIGELMPRMQGKLRRVLEGEIPADLRLLAATSQDLEAAVRAGRFCPHLYRRLSQVQVRVPALRERCDDIIPLAEFFLGQSNPDAWLAPDAKDALQGYNWPGNVRQLRHVITAAAVVNPGSQIEAADLTPPV